MTTDHHTLSARGKRKDYDAAIIGSGPNGLAAAICLAEAGCRVIVFEARKTIGGGLRSLELTLPGYTHDVCATIHSLGVTSPFFQNRPFLQIEWIYPDVQLAHPFDDGTAVGLYRSLVDTAAALGEDETAYRRLLAPLVRRWQAVLGDTLAPLRLPRHPLAMARFALRALWPARTLAYSWFRTEQARGLFAGLAGHSMLPLEKPISSAFGLMLALTGHAAGWPVAKGGSQRVAHALGTYLRELGGEIVTDYPVRQMEDLPAASAVLFDMSPRQMLAIAGDRFPAGYRRRLQKYRYGPGVCKVDWALNRPIPWIAPLCQRTATVHLGSTLAEISTSERQMWRGQPPDSPFVILVQQSQFDPTRAPAGKHTAWAYCHVPHGSTQDMTAQIEAQVERYAPGFRDCVLARHTYTAQDMEGYNPNYVGGAITGGVQDVRQLFTRPVARLNPYTTPDPQIFLCSAATPPGGGVHGMCGYHAAQAALRTL